MHQLLRLALVLPLAACVVGSDEYPGGHGGGGGNGMGSGDGTGGGGGGGGGNGDGISGRIDQDATWSGTVRITGQTTIAPGVAITVEPGTTIQVDPAVGVSVEGLFEVLGTKAEPVTIGPTTPGQHFSGFKIPSGGELRLSYAQQTGGGITTTGGKATIVDTYMSRVGGDFLVMSGGEVDMSYSQIGVGPGETDTTHCNLHFGGTVPNTIKVTRSNINGSPYGLMFYAGTNANFTYNNWYDNQIDVDTSAGVQGDFSGSWFQSGPPRAQGNGGATLVLNALSDMRLTDAGPR